MCIKRQKNATEGVVRQNLDIFLTKSNTPVQIKKLQKLIWNGIMF